MHAKRVRKMVKHTPSYKQRVISKQRGICQAQYGQGSAECTLLSCVFRTVKSYQVYPQVFGHDLGFQSLSLYTTVTQNYSRWVLVSAWTPTLLRHLTKICVSPDANPRRQSVKYRWRWVFWLWPCIFHVYFIYISCIFHVYFMYISCIFHVVCASFSALATQKLGDAQPVFSGVWALRIDYCGWWPILKNVHNIHQ